ncbi:MAG: hypothetical protein U5J63_03925 [Fodinibius sp.]|nr:hypothetical protein [Fodinibius sp.]
MGCENLVVIETADAVLVADKSQSQQVKHVVDTTRRTGTSGKRPAPKNSSAWGSYEGVDAGDNFQVKRLVINPEKLSLQMHEHRAEHWVVVVRGVARVTRDQAIFFDFQVTKGDRRSSCRYQTSTGKRHCRAA